MDLQRQLGCHSSLMCLRVKLTIHVQLLFKPFLHFLHLLYRVSPSQLKVVVGQVSLIQTDVDETWISVFKTNIYEGYDELTGLHDIAMLQVNKRDT